MNSSTLRPTYYNIADGVCAFSTTRHGGTSEGSYASLNINPYCGDTSEHVATNRSLLAAELGISTNHILLPHQTHGTEARIVDDELLALPEEERAMRLEGVDALLTDMNNVCIGVSTADCIPVLLYDEEHHATAAIHAGWRGTVARIVSKTIAHMSATYKTDAKKLKAVIGPGISQKNFEVGDEVYAAFEAAAFDMKAIARREAKWHIDLPLCNRQQLIQAGVAEQNIIDCGICTFDNVEDYFSARRLGINSGRIYTGIILL